MDNAAFAATKFKADLEALAEIGSVHEFRGNFLGDNNALQIGIQDLGWDDFEMTQRSQGDLGMAEIMLETGTYMIEQSDRLVAFGKLCNSAGCRMMIVAMRLALAQETAAGEAQS